MERKRGPQTGVIYIRLPDTLPLNASYPNASIQLVGAERYDVKLWGDVTTFSIAKGDAIIFQLVGPGLGDPGMFENIGLKLCLTAGAACQILPSLLWRLV